MRDGKLNECDAVCGVTLNEGESACSYTVDELCGGSDTEDRNHENGGGSNE